MTHPIDSVQWIPIDRIRPNNYNPNAQTAENHSLLVESLQTDGWTTAIVVTPPDADGIHTIIDGEHRYRAACAGIRGCGGNAPCVILDRDEAGCMAATVRHNRARGQHGVADTLAIVQSLDRAGKTDAEIQQSLGMTKTELERLRTSEDLFLAIQAGEDGAMQT